MTSDRTLGFGPFRLDLDTESVWRDGGEIRLRPKSFAVLRYLAEQPRRVITKEELLRAIWPEVTVGDAALAMCVAEIRKALGDMARTPRFIVTVHRRGYRFIGTSPADMSQGGDDEPARAEELVGRTGERDRLRSWLERARRGARQVVFVTGEPGIGKTALVEAFLAGLPAGDLWIARGHCLDHYGAGEAYRPILEALGRLARGPGGDRVLSVLGRHAPTWLAQMPALVSADALAALQPHVLGATRERMLREMADATEALAAERPLVLLLEDLHWSDPSTLDLIAAVAHRREPTRLLLIGTYRPMDVLARGHPLRTVTQRLAIHHAGEALALEPLDASAVERYLTGRFGHEIGARLGLPVHRRTDGLPLFMVNIVEALIRQGLLVEVAGRWEARTVDLETASVPENLRQMIEQQLEGLGADDQRLLAAASVAGMTFSSATLAAALDVEVEAVEERCAALARRQQFIRAAGVDEWPDGTVAARYRFLHVLYEHVLYERLPVAQRASLHRRIGERDEAGFRARPGERAAALALHFERGRDGTRAVRYHHQAAEHALHRCAYREAVTHISRGRELLDAVPDERERSALELGLQTTLGPALIALWGSGAPEVEVAYRRAHELAEYLGDAGRLYQALWGLWYVDYTRGRHEAAREMGQRLLALAERGSDAGRLREAHHALWCTLFAMGEPSAALIHIERAHRIDDPTHHRSQASLYGSHDASACSWFFLAFVRWLLGEPTAALAALREARAMAARLDHPLTTVICLDFSMWVHYYRGDVEEARADARSIISLAAAHGFSGQVDDGPVVLRCTASSESQADEPIRVLYRRVSGIRPGLSAWRNILCLCALARAAAARDDVELGFEIMAAIPEEHRGTFMAPEIERIRGELLLRRGDRPDAEQCFRRALELAHRRSERSLALRAAMSLARGLGRSGACDEARQMLGAVYGRFTEGFDTADLREARALLDDLTDRSGATTRRR